jgi:membrane protease YdiL (CAAX protease family)
LTGPGGLVPPEPSAADSALTDLPPSGRPGIRTFSLDGRRAPGLYLVGWLTSLLGVATIFVVLLAQPSDLAGAVLLGLGTLLLSTGLAAAAGSQAMERQAAEAGAGAQGYRGPSPVIVFGAYVALALFLELIIFVPLKALGVQAGTAAEALVGLLIINGTAVLMVAVLVVGSGSLSWRELGLPGRPFGRLQLAIVVRDLLEGMIVAVPVLFVTVGLNSLLIRLLGSAPPGPLPVALTPADAAINLVSGILIAPFGEELFYRGFATTAWVRGMGVRAGILRAALLFCVAHVLTLSGSPSEALIAFVARLPVAIALGWIFIRRGSLASSFGLHAMFNAIPLILVGLSVGG